MPRLNYVKKARKDNPVVKKGQSYYWWKFPYRPKNYSKERPARSSLTQSEFYGTLYDIQDEKDGFDASDELPMEVENLVSRLNELIDECQDKLDNMPDSLQEASNLNDRISELESRVSDLECLYFEDWDENNETKDEYWERKLEEVNDIDLDIE